GSFLIVAGLLRIGTYIKYIPHAVTVGFTAGIAVIIFASQIRDLLGITLTGKEPGELLPKLAALGRAIGSTSPFAVAISAATIA
ncbi:SulP family inorganic anion transporter, partial [Acinetobacter baumannii]